VPTELTQLFEDLNKETLRIRRPSKIIFFCGGAMENGPRVAGSLRRYLLRDRRIDRRIKASLILAEKANSLYRDTSYSDLITFEEDIARISAMVLVIAESPGSFAELGAFVAIDAIRRALAVLIQTEHEERESFIRYGPIQKIKNEDDRRIGTYPWKVHKNGAIVKASVRSHVTSVIGFINELLGSPTSEEQFAGKDGIESFIIILWVLHLSQAIAIRELYDYTSKLIPLEENELKNKLFCMQLAGWVEKYSYGNKTYWYSVSEYDPISSYSFKAGAVNRPSERKLTVTTAIYNEINLPKHVRSYVASAKIEARKAPHR
jgi:hypothetical protein